MEGGYLYVSKNLFIRNITSLSISDVDVEFWVKTFRVSLSSLKIFSFSVFSVRVF